MKYIITSGSWSTIPRSEVNELVGRGRGRGDWKTYNPTSQPKFLQIPVSLSLGARGFFLAFRDDRIQRQSREGETSNSALGCLRLSREGESEKTSGIQVSLRLKKVHLIKETKKSKVKIK